MTFPSMAACFWCTYLLVCCATIQKYPFHGSLSAFVRDGDGVDEIDMMLYNLTGCDLVETESLASTF